MRVLRWDDLGDELARRAAALAAQANDLRRQEEYSSWARQAVSRSVDELASIVRRHVVAFPEAVRSQLSLDIATPSTAHAEQRVLCINFGVDSVHLHAQWRKGEPPSLHVLLSRKRGGRDARLVTLPGGWLRPTSSAAGFQLCSFDSSSHEVPLEELAYRALRLLAAGI